ncbi:site-specific recombinase, DNA invertase Pin [Schinkia azotoformans MEV2011]|uniref:Site-specific recombinase, DNA invertase Pin n=1 Tax=Schinkia azotoformans MEV2011 TaxID=1348973 RepID=A0A072NRY5_SCHAZ|nr:recombinase family protein [Schinkia azotoformans]KEF40474.1 site-specific recombinase, DNA invertase Pin [Schinkia azotoformans MEV2011]MEC1696118.1 recombinase family protein [Schinkia azotoformans]MEC1716668.1 recombinase family protein [Schinkia azotoformans]MEC1725379.1 recombinase family protein [Schinkia azotoformans]MEC1739507.1 recombinase family protein [Schinkia azotoformans]
MKVAIYIRVSTDEQAKEGYSIPAQREKLAAYCKAQGWNEFEFYPDEGISGKDMNRKYLQLMLKDIEAGKINRVLVYKLDRLSRSQRDTLTLIEDYFLKNKVEFVSLTENLDTSTPFGRAMIGILSAFAQLEREQIGERVSFAQEKKVRSGKWKGGMPPYGYKLVDKELVIDDEEARTVRLIFKLSRRFGFLTIAKRLKGKTRKGGDWHVDTVRDIANNPVYAGYLTYNKDDYKKPPREKKLFEGVHERIISREEFWELQDILDKRRTFGGKRETSNYYFSSILKCGRCGHSMSGHKAGTNNKDKCYRCSGKKAGKKCTSHLIKEENLVKTVLLNLDDLLKNIQGPAENNDISSEIVRELESELKNVQKLMNKQKMMYENDIISIEELIKKTDTLREQEKQLQAEFKKYTIPIENAEEIKFLAENISSLWGYADDYERKEMMSTLFKQLVIDTSGDYKRGTGDHREILILSAK